MPETMAQTRARARTHTHTHTHGHRECGAPSIAYIRPEEGVKAQESYLIIPKWWSYLIDRISALTNCTLLPARSHLLSQSCE